MADLSSVGVANPSTSSANPVLSLILALGAGLLTWGFIHLQDPQGDGIGLFEVDEKYHIRGLGESDERWSAYLEQQSRVDLQNAALVIGILGSALGAALAIGGPAGLPISKRLPIGILFGAVVGVVAGLAGSMLQQSFEKSSQISVELSAFVNALLFGILGFGLGAMVGGLCGSAKAIVERSVIGLVVGALAGCAYPIIAYVFIANVNIEAFIPRVTAARVLWLGVGTSVIGLLIPWGVGKRIVEVSKLVDRSAPMHT